MTLPETPEIAALRARNIARDVARDARGGLLWVVISEWVEGVDRSTIPTAAHLTYQLQLERSCALFAAGPFANADETPIGGLIILRAPDRDTAEKLALKDPFHAGGFRSFTLFRWKMHEGHMRVVVDLGAGTVEIE